jgi:hypothetical protein
MAYDKMDEFIETLFDVFKMVTQLVVEKKETKYKFIAAIIHNYILKTAKSNNIDMSALILNDTYKTQINLIPFFEYVTHNNIEFYDFNNIELLDVDTSKNEDIERFVLSHVYYITQK